MELLWYNIKTLSPEDYSAALAMMSAERRRRVSDLPAEDDRKRSAAGELLARQALSARLGVAAQAVPLLWDENGKPTVEGGTVYVSVSHSGPWVICAVGDRPLGADVEVLRGAEEKFMARACSQAEMDYIRFPRQGCYQRFWECWTAKEALFKVTGKGPLLALSRLALPEGVTLDYMEQNGCAVTVAQQVM